MVRPVHRGSIPPVAPVMKPKQVTRHKKSPAERILEQQTLKQAAKRTSLNPAGRGTIIDTHG
jgi:hypothetical protein